MITIEFNFNQKITIIQANLSDPFRIPLNQFSKKTLIPLDSLNFIANYLPIKPEKTIESHMSSIDIQNGKLNVIVDVAIKSNKNKVDIQPNDIICPECKEPCRIKIEDYHVKLYYLFINI